MGLTKPSFSYSRLQYLSTSTVFFRHQREYRLTKVKCSASLPLLDTQLVDSHNRSPHVEPSAAVCVSGHKVKDRSTSSGSCRADEYSVASTQKVEDGYAEIHTAGEMFPTLRNKYILPWPWCFSSEYSRVILGRQGT